jgi:hypothetical protein
MQQQRGAGGQQLYVVNTNQKREVGRRAQLSNINAGRAVSDIIRTTLGPRSMLKMLLDPMGGIVITNDGNCILRELDVSHPAAKSMIELSRAQDEEVGDGTTSVIVLGMLIFFSICLVGSCDFVPCGRFFFFTMDLNCFENVLTLNVYK